MVEASYPEVNTDAIWSHVGMYTEIPERHTQNHLDRGPKSECEDANACVASLFYKGNPRPF